MKRHAGQSTASLFAPLPPLTTLPGQTVITLMLHSVVFPLEIDR